MSFCIFFFFVKTEISEQNIIKTEEKQNIIKTEEMPWNGQKFESR